MHQGLTQCPPPSVHSALNATDRCALCVLQVDEFVHFAKENEFLRMWFGHLAEERKGASWKDADLAL